MSGFVTMVQRLMALAALATLLLSTGCSEPPLPTARAGKQPAGAKSRVAADAEAGNARPAAKPKAKGLIELPSVAAAKAPELEKLVITAFGDRPQAVQGSLLIGPPRVAGELRVHPLEPSTSAIVFAPDGKAAFALCKQGVARLNPATLAVVGAVKPFHASDLLWCGGKLIVIGKSQRYYEFFDSGGIRTHIDPPPSPTPSRQVSTREFWIVDPQTLRVDTGYRFYGDRLICAKNSLFAVSLDDDFSFDLLDLKSGKRLARYDVADFAAELGWENVEQSRGRPRIHDIHVAASGNALYALVGRTGGSRICRFDRQGAKLTLTAESTPHPIAQLPDARLFVAPDESFIAYQSEDTARYLKTAGFVVYPLPELGKPLGGISAGERDVQVAFDMPRKVAFTFGSSGKLSVARGGERREFPLGGGPGEELAGMMHEFELPTFIAAPHLKAVIVLGSRMAAVIQTPGGAEPLWPFDPPPALLPDLAAKKLSAPRGEQPDEPLKFTPHPEIEPAVPYLDAPDYDAAWFALNGEAFYLWNPWEGVLSRFNSDTGVEERRLTPGRDDGWSAQISALGPVLHSGDGLRLRVLDGETLDATIEFSLPEAFSVVTVPSSALAVIMEGEQGLRLTRLADGKTIDTVRFDDFFYTLSAEQQETIHEIPSMAQMEMSLDGSRLFVLFNRGELFSVFAIENDKLVHLESAANPRPEAYTPPVDVTPLFYKHLGWQDPWTEGVKPLTKSPIAFQGRLPIGDSDPPHLAIDADGRRYQSAGPLTVTQPNGEEVPVAGFDDENLSGNWVAIDGAQPGRVLYLLEGRFFLLDAAKRR